MAGLGKRLAMGPEGMPRYSRWAAAPPAAADRGRRKRRGWVNPGSHADPLAVHPVYNRRDGCGGSGAGLCWILPNRARPGLPSGQLPAKPQRRRAGEKSLLGVMEKGIESVRASRQPGKARPRGAGVQLRQGLGDNRCVCGPQPRRLVAGRRRPVGGQLLPVAAKGRPGGGKRRISCFK